MARTRLKVLMLMTAVPALAIFGRLWSLQMDPVQHQLFRTRAENSKLNRLPPVRGAIYDRNGEILADNRSGFDLHFVYSDLNPRHIVLEVICEELSRTGDFPSVSQVRAGLAELVNIDSLEKTLSQGLPPIERWLPLVDWVPSQAAEQIRRRLGPRRFFRENFQLRQSLPGSSKGDTREHFGLWFRPDRIFQMELTLRRLASEVDRYSLEDLHERLLGGLKRIDTMVARYVRGDVKAGADELFTRKKARNSRRLHYRMGWLLAPDISLKAVSTIEYNPDLFPGLRVVDSSRRVYPRGEAFGPITGHLKKLNQHDIESLENKGLVLDRYPEIKSVEAFSVLRQGALRRNDLIGQGGLEEEYDTLLRGEYGMRLEQAGKEGDRSKLLASLASVKGTDIHTTLDGKLQEILYRQLWAECAHHGHAAASAAIMDLPSGALLASAAFPSYDPNRIREPAYRQQMEDSVGAQTPDWLLDRPRSKALYPGSIFKIVTTIASLENGHDWEGPVDPLRKYECLVGDQKPFAMRCSSRFGHGEINLYEAFQASCNNYFYYLSARHLAPANFDFWARNLGCGSTTGIDLPPMGGTYDKGFLEKNKAVAGERGLCMYGIGQRQVQMTPLQALRMVGSVALGLKKAPRPWLVSKRQPTELYTRNPRTAAVIEECMKRVVSDPHGTVYGKSGLENFNFAAKTGTAQYRAGALRYHSWLVGYGPLPNPSMAFVVVCEKSRLGGGDACSPIVREIMEYFGGNDSRFHSVPPQDPLHQVETGG